MNRYNVVIADDHAILRDGLKIALNTDPKFRVVGEAENGEEAIKLVEEKIPDILVMDVDMPKMNGIEAARKIKSKNKNIKILLLTMHDNENYIFDALGAGVDGYIFKLADMEFFLEALTSIAEGKKYFDAKVSELLVNSYRNKKNSGFKEDDIVPLTKREIEILELISKGETTNDIAEKLFISFFTVSKHRKNIMKKLKVKNSAELIKYAYEHNLIRKMQG